MKITHLRASSAHRWIECHASPHAERIAPSIQSDNEAATEGTAAARLMELCLKNREDASEYAGTEIRLASEKRNWEVSDDMADHIQAGLNLIREHVGKGTLWSEREVHFKVRGVVVGGTLDAGWHGQYKSELKKTAGKLVWQLHIMDLKYGRILVEAHDNKQMMIYAKGKMRELLAANKKVDEIHLWIFQPRNEITDGIPFQHVTITPFDLEEFVATTLDESVKGVLAPNPTFNPGPHCLYCKAQSTCVAAEKLALKQLRNAHTAPTRDRVGELLFAANFAIKYWNKIRELGKQMGRDRTPPTGWKMVEGSRVRRFPGKETEQMKTVLPKLRKITGQTENELAPRKLLSVSKVEKVLKEKGKKKELIENLYIVTRQQDRLVPESDKRDAISAAMFFEDEGPDDGQAE